MKGYKGFEKGLVCKGKQYAENTNDGYRLKNFKSHKVDGKIIKPDTWYKLVNGKFKRCD